MRSWSSGHLRRASPGDSGFLLGEFAEDGGFEGPGAAPGGGGHARFLAGGEAGYEQALLGHGMRPDSVEFGVDRGLSGGVVVEVFVLGEPGGRLAMLSIRPVSLWRVGLAPVLAAVMVFTSGLRSGSGFVPAAGLGWKFQWLLLQGIGAADPAAAARTKRRGRPLCFCWAGSRDGGGVRSRRCRGLPF